MATTTFSIHGSIDDERAKDLSKNWQSVMFHIPLAVAAIAISLLLLATRWDDIPPLSRLFAIVGDCIALVMWRASILGIRYQFERHAELHEELDDCVETIERLEAELEAARNAGYSATPTEVNVE